MGNCYSDGHSSEPPFNGFPSALEQAKSLAIEVEKLNKNIEGRVANMLAEEIRTKEELAYTRGEGPGMRYSGGP